MHGTWNRIFIAVVAGAAGFAAITGGCAVNRPALSREEIERRRAIHMAAVERHHHLSLERFVRRMEREAEANVAGGPPPVFDILILSGGGDHGAFGVGVLKGWGMVRDPAWARPEFDVVTGVSTGALIAPFAFLGDEASYNQIVDLYENPREDWVRFRGLLFFMPWKESFMDASGLERDVKHAFSLEMIGRIAEAETVDRSLVVGATDLDLGMMHAWDLTTEAKKVATTADPKRFHKVLMASSAIPAAFPPVVIDDTLYVDGGTTSNILYGADLRGENAPVSVFRRQHPGLPCPKYRFWVIVNNQLGGEAQVVQPTWVSITKASVSTAIRSSTIGTLKQLSLQAELQRYDGLDVEFRYIAIPDSWRPPVEGMFRKETMTSLAELGLKMGADPASWRSDLAEMPKFDDERKADPATPAPAVPASAEPAPAQ